MIKIKHKILNKLVMVLCIVIILTSQNGFMTINEVQANSKQHYKVVLEPKLKYDYISYSDKDIERNYVYIANEKTNSKGEKTAEWGLTDLKGNIIIPCKYETIELLNDEKILVSDTNKNWYMFDKNGEQLYSYGRYESINPEGNNLLRADIYENGEYYGYKLLKYNGEVVYAYIDEEAEEITVEYTGNIKYDKLELLENGKYYIAFNVEQIEDDGDYYEKEYGYLIKPDGTIIYELGYVSSYRDYYTVLNFDTLDRDKSGYDEEGYYHSYFIETFINMQGKIERIEYEHSKGGRTLSGEDGGWHLGKYDDKLVYIEFPSLQKVIINPETTIIDYNYLYRDDTICVRGEDNIWYQYNSKGELLKTITSSIDFNRIITWESKWILAEGKTNTNTYIYYFLDKNGKMIKSYNKYNYLTYEYIYGEEASTVGIYGYEDDNKYDLINNKTGQILCEGINDFSSSLSNKIIGYVNNDGMWSILNNDKTQIQLGKFDDVYDMQDSSNIIVAEKEGLIYIFNATGQLIVDEAQVAWQSEYNSDILVIKKNEEWLLIKTDGKIIKNIGKVGWIYGNHTVFFFAEDSQLGGYGQPLTKVSIYNKQGKLLAEGTDYISYNHNKVIVKDNKGIWKEINEDGKILAEYGKYEKLTVIGNIIIASEKIEWNSVFRKHKYTNPVILNEDGTVIFNKGEIEDIGNINGSYVTVKVKDRWGILNIVDNSTIKKDILINSIKITSSTSSVKAGKKIKLNASVNSNATNKSIVWSSSNKKYATVDKNGLVTTKKAGAGKTVTITAKATDGSGKTATFKLKIKKISIKKLKLKLSKKSIKVGKKLKVKAVITPSNATNKNIKWYVSNKKYAKINSKGVLIAKKAGAGKTVKITAKAKDGSGKKATIKIKIKK